ncbi:Histidine kinase [Desulfamplus magnetovallimortis]|uniref:histidine kinase n=1 Tax=Desulfamplus magnetovallimortis TaxID=1246637 RepID=A0A1W1HC29_9BACT|nr:ATP-binding protein [Desulfamplus magnetovallimortis]SLM30051.1 Histidine kinase [Desulfamplus magnetovallimortis]
MVVFKANLQRKFLLTIIAIIVPVLGIIFTWVTLQTIKQAHEEALDRARIISRQVVLTRKWVTDCGGSVLVQEKTPGSEGITCFFDTQFQINEKIYRPFSPAMVTQKLSMYSSQESLYSFRLSSLTPINPENAPTSPFEIAALKKFALEGKGEAWYFGDHALEYMIPLYLEKGCLRCHTSDDIAGQPVMGGLSIVIPVEKIQSSIRKNSLILAVSGISLTLLTVGILFFLMRHMIIKPLEILEAQSREISRGNLNVHASINTGDELERLARCFNSMASSLFEERNNLQAEISRATESLATAHEELKKADQLKSDFLANMSHELRSPITVIRGGINYLSRTLEKEDNKRYAEIIEKNVNRLTHLVSDLFDFTKLEAGKIEWDFSLENITVLIEEVIEIISPLSDQKNLAVDYTHQGDMFVELDFERMEQVLVNLMDNAIKYAYPNTTIEINLKQDNDDALLSIKDHGQGIPEENLKTIFDKFSTVPSVSKGNVEGTGLGLAISRAIVEAHGGRIFAESEIGVSSTFFVRLPIASE